MTDTVIITIVGAVSTVAIGALNAWVSVRLHKKVDVVSATTNGLLADKIADTKSIAHAEGVAQASGEAMNNVGTRLAAIEQKLEDLPCNQPGALGCAAKQAGQPPPSTPQ